MTLILANQFDGLKTTMVHTSDNRANRFENWFKIVKGSEIEVVGDPCPDLSNLNANMKNNEEFFAFIQILIAELESLGEENLATGILSAQSISTVPGEILGALRLELKDLRKRKLISQLKSKECVHDAIDYLDNILGSS